MSTSTAKSQRSPGTVLITGASGFVGRHIVEAIDQLGVDVIGLDLDQPATRTEPGRFLQCDVTDSDRLTDLITSHAPDAIVHAAAITPADDERARAPQILEVNYLSTLTVLLASAKSQCGKVIYLSSAGVYANPATGTILSEESSVADQGSLYAQTKLASERLCEWARRELGISATALRIGPVYGEFEHPTESRPRMSPIYRAIALARDGKTVRCNAGQTIYNWIHGQDVGRAATAVLHADEPDAVYNVAGPLASVAQTLAGIQRLIPDFKYEWTGNENSANLKLSTVSRPISSRRIACHLGYQPDVSLSDGLERTVSAVLAGQP